MNSDLQPPKQMVAWLRAKAKEYEEMAVQIETRFLDAAKAAREATPHLPAMSHLSVGQLQGFLLLRSARIGDLAEHFNVDEKRIREIVENPANGFVVAKRGWVKLAGQVDSNQPQ